MNIVDPEGRRFEVEHVVDPDIALVSLRGGKLQGCAEIIDGRIVANLCAYGKLHRFGPRRRGCRALRDSVAAVNGLAEAEALVVVERSLNQVEKGSASRVPLQFD